MHGRRRLPPGAEQLMDEENKKAAKAHALVQAALQSRKQGQTPPPIIAATDAVLARNPEVYSLWNLKREVLQPIMATSEGAAEATKQMQLVELCLQKNHKSYAAWHQRQWLVEQGHVDKSQDLKAVERLLSQVHGDPKNFHAWKYRSWLTEQLKLPPSTDLDFTEALLKADPSNFSAWHMRMRALSADHYCSNTAMAATGPDMQTGTCPPDGGDATAQDNSPQQQAAQQHKGTQTLPLEFSVIEQELKLLHELVAVDPANSSSWSFHRWLLQCACCETRRPSTQHDAGVHTEAADPAAPTGEERASERRDCAKRLLRDERGMCEGIAAEEARRIEALAAEGGVVPSGGVESVTVSLARMGHVRALQAVADVLALELQMADSEEEAEAAREASRHVLLQLKVVDASRGGFYDDQLSAIGSAA